MKKSKSKLCIANQSLWFVLHTAVHLNAFSAMGGVYAKTKYGIRRRLIIMLLFKKFLENILECLELEYLLRLQLYKMCH